MQAPAFACARARRALCAARRDRLLLPRSTRMYCKSQAFSVKAGDLDQSSVTAKAA